MTSPLLELFAWSRVGLGVSAIVAPAPVARAFGLGDDASVAVAARMLGGRDLFMALGILLAKKRGKSPRGWLEAAVAVDVVDALATAEGVRAGVVDSKRAVPIAALIAASIALGALLISQARSSGDADTSP